MYKEFNDDNIKGVDNNKDKELNDVTKEGRNRGRNRHKKDENAQA